MGDCKDSKHCKEHHLCKLIKREDLEQIKKLVKDAAVLLQEVRAGRARQGQPLRPVPHLAGRR